MSAKPTAVPHGLRTTGLYRDLGWSHTPFLSTCIAVAVLGVLPFVWRNDYIISLLVLTFITTIMTQSWNITIGVSGVWNFGQLAVIALGGYAAGILNINLGVNPWLTLPAGTVVGGCAAIVMLLPSTRLRGIYAAMLTFAFAEVVRLLVLADSTGLTGGPFGLSGIGGLFDSLSSDASLRAYYWLTLAMSAGVMLMMHRIMNSPLGMALVSQRESIRFSIGMGINRRRLYVVVALISGLVGGLAGSLYATFYHSMTPSLMGLAPMGAMVTMIVIGGLGTVRGPIIGAFAVTILSEVLRDAVMWRLVVQGAILLLVLAFFPAGLDGLAVRGVRALRKWMNAGEGAGDASGDAGRRGPAGAPLAEDDASVADKRR